MINGQVFVYEKLTGDTVIASLTSNRIAYGWQEVTAEMPAVTFFEVSSTPRPARDLVEEVYQIDAWDYASAGTVVDAIAERIVSIFDFISGTTGVVRSRVLQVREDFEGELRRKSIDVQLFVVL